MQRCFTGRVQCKRTMQNNQKSIHLKLALKLFIAGFLLVQTLAPICAQAADDDEYNFSWLDPDKKIYVLQNRKYRKAKKVHLTLMGGAAIAENYRQVWQVQPRIGTWFNEDFGIEGFFTARFHTENNTYKAMVQALGSALSPYIRETNSQYGLLLNWAPWYAKINVFNTILYFDWYFSLGAGMLNTSIGPNSKSQYPSLWKDENLFAVFLGTGQMFHLSQVLDFRLDFLTHFYSAEIYGGAPGTPTDKAIFSNFAINVGLGVKL